MPNFLKLQTDLLNYCSVPVDGDQLVMAKSAINRYHMEILRAIGQDVLTREFSFDTIDGTKQYGLSSSIQDVLNIEDPANIRRLINVTSGYYDRAWPGTTETGAPHYYYELNRQGVRQQPESAGVLSVVSDNTLDTTNYFIRFVGFDSNGELQSEKVTLTGTSSVSTAQSFDPDQGGVVRMSKSTTSDSYGWNGTLTVSDDAGGADTAEYDYAVIYDPVVYPVDPAGVTGRSAPGRAHERMGPDEEYPPSKSTFEKGSKIG